MYPKLQETIQQLAVGTHTSESRQDRLAPLIAYIQQKTNARQTIVLHFICTHNSRRSHLAQIWAQVAAAYHGISPVHCYSGGTETTALFPTVTTTLSDQGFEVFKIAEGHNPIYAIKYEDDAPPIIGFSKKYDHAFNSSSGFAAVMTCSQADGDCPFIAGAEQRISIPYKDPKESDGMPNEAKTYAERSLEIASDLFYAFAMIKKTII